MNHEHENCASGIEVVPEPGKIGVIFTHGPLVVTIALTPDQAVTLAAAMTAAAQQAREMPPPGKATRAN